MPLAQIDSGTQQVISTVLNAPLASILAATLLFFGLAAFAQVLNQTRLTVALNRKVEQDATQTAAVKDLAQGVTDAVKASARAADTSLATHKAILKVGRRMDQWEARQRRLLLGEFKQIYDKTCDLEARMLAMSSPEHADEIKREFDAAKKKIIEAARLLKPDGKDTS